MKAQPEGPHRDDPIRLGGLRFIDEPDHPRLRFQDKALREALDDLPHGVYEGANRYDTDDELVLHLWRGGQSWDIRLPRLSEPSR